jgi:hypothetical protein
MLPQARSFGRDCGSSTGDRTPERFDPLPGGLDLCGRNRFRRDRKGKLCARICDLPFTPGDHASCSAHLSISALHSAQVRRRL